MHINQSKLNIISLAMLKCIVQKSHPLSVTFLSTAAISDPDKLHTVLYIEHEFGK